MSAHIPQYILDAIRQVAEYTRQSGYGEVLISQTGDTSFRSAKPKEEYNSRKVGAIFLFLTTVTNSASAIQGQPRPLGTLQDSLLIAVGLAALSKSQSPILFGFFCVAGFLCFVFWVWESFGRKLQQKGH